MWNELSTWIALHRAQLVPLAFGALAVYLLMPPRRLVTLAIALGILATVGVLSFAIVAPGTGLGGVLFYLFAGTAILAAASTVTQPNPVYSALSFALVTLSVAGLFLLRAAPFLAAATVIIYAGAIVVTFLFIMMLARQSGNAIYDRSAREPILSTLAAFVLLGAILLTIEQWVTQRAGAPAVAVTEGRAVGGQTTGGRFEAGYVPIPAAMRPHQNSTVRADEQSRLRGLGRSLFSDYLVTVELAGTLLLVAGVGAVAIAPRRVFVRARGSREGDGRVAPSSGSD
jgi:NADH-quinone oxidoreductase subunit J